MLDPFCHAGTETKHLDGVSHGLCGPKPDPRHAPSGLPSKHSATLDQGRAQAGRILPHIPRSRHRGGTAHHFLCPTSSSCFFPPPWLAQALRDRVFLRRDSSRPLEGLWSTRDSGRFSDALPSPLFPPRLFLIPRSSSIKAALVVPQAYPPCALRSLIRLLPPVRHRLFRESRSSGSTAVRPPALP